jgi:hypothetical protein
MGRFGGDVIRITIWLAAVSTALVLAPAAGAATTTLDATADSRVETAKPKSNFGGDTLKAQLGGIRSYIRFNLSGLPAGEIRAATLRVTPITGSSPGLKPFAVASESWTEAGITWNNAPGPVGSGGGQTGSWSGRPAWVSMDVTSIVAGKTGDVSMIVEAAGSGDATQFTNREYGAGPKLDVVTEPTTSPALSVSPSSLSFAGGASGNPASKSLSVSNAGGGTLTYTVGDDADWLSESPTSGTAPGSVSVTASTAGLAAGTHTATITVDGGTAQGSPATIPVTLTVTAGCNRMTSLAAAQSEIAAGRDACLADGTYSGALTLSTSAASRVTLSAERQGMARVSGLVTLNSHTAIDGLDLTNASDCVSIPTGKTDIAVLNSTIHDCGRDGIRWARPALDGSNESSNVLVRGNVIRNVTWNSMTVRGDSATVTNNELTRSTNDAITLWGNGHAFRFNHIHDYSNSVGNHNDAFQTWGGGDDGFRGTPLTNLLIEANRIVNILGTDAHGFMASGPNSNFTIRRNLWWNIGSYALNIQPGQTNVDQLYNTFVRTGNLEYHSGTSGRIVGNIFADVRPYYVTGCTCTRDYNLATTWAPSEMHGLQADPLFASASDFHLQATSPAVDTGDPATVPPIDIEDKPVAGKAPDRGAYERQPG